MSVTMLAAKLLLVPSLILLLSLALIGLGRAGPAGWSLRPFGSVIGNYLARGCAVLRRTRRQSPEIKLVSCPIGLCLARYDYFLA